MTAEWNPADYTDDYRNALEKMIEEKIEKGDSAKPAKVRRKRPENVIDLVSVLKKSIQETSSGRAEKKRSGKGKTRRAAA